MTTVKEGQSGWKRWLKWSEIGPRIPGFLSTLAMMLVTSAWVLWSTGEMYYEGWSVKPWYVPLIYLIPGTACLVLSFAALTWPRAAGLGVVVVGALFTLWWFGPDLARGTVSMNRITSQLPVSGSLVLIGLLFILHGQYRRRRRAEGWEPPANPWLRNLRYIVGVGIPLLAAVGMSITNLPIVLTRVDDGDRGARLIEGNGVTLVWAPEGPGWNWKQEWGGYPSWSSIALYGTPPVGIDKPREWGELEPIATAEDMEQTNVCRYLSEDGLTLMDEPQDIWRMPTTDEMVRSLVHHGENAGCTWNRDASAEGGRVTTRAECEVTPDKETPLWAPNRPPVYYWTADEYDEDNAYYVSYNGWINSQPKRWGNPRHGYRCVKEP